MPPFLDRQQPRAETLRELRMLLLTNNAKPKYPLSSEQQFERAQRLRATRKSSV